MWDSLKVPYNTTLNKTQRVRGLPLSSGSDPELRCRGRVQLLVRKQIPHATIKTTAQPNKLVKIILKIITNPVRAQRPSTRRPSS